MTSRALSHPIPLGARRVIQGFHATAGRCPKAGHPRATRPSTGIGIGVATHD